VDARGDLGGDMTAAAASVGGEEVAEAWAERRSRYRIAGVSVVYFGASKQENARQATVT
jgi:hypothetical protein